MRRILGIALVLGGVFVSVMALGKIADETDATAIVVNGLHVAIPINMKTFPEELVPLP
jgi:hypothetical protein